MRPDQDNYRIPRVRERGPLYKVGPGPTDSSGIEPDPGRRDSDRLPIEAIHLGSRRRTYAGYAARGELDTEVERVGGRRRIRGEVVLLVVGLVFVAAALFKPWTVGHAGSSPSARGLASGLAVAQASASVSPTSVDPTLSYDPFARYPISWPLVNWSALTAPDSHSGWGVATATLPHYYPWSSGANSAAPTIGWLASASIPMAANIKVEPGLLVFAVAITWPKGVRVDGMSFTYNGPGWPLAGAGGAGGYPPVTSLSPLPAAEVTGTGEAATPHTPAVQSGDFWVAPVEETILPGLESPSLIWKVMPWSWPMGEYKVTFRSQGSDQTMIVRLEQHP